MASCLTNNKNKAFYQALEAYHYLVYSSGLSVFCLFLHGRWTHERVEGHMPRGRNLPWRQPPREGQPRSAVASDVPHMPTTARTAPWTSPGAKVPQQGTGRARALRRTAYPPYSAVSVMSTNPQSYWLFPGNISISIFTVGLPWTIKGKNGIF